MKTYNIIFGTDFNNRSTLKSQLSFIIRDKENKKTVADIKDFITCIDDSICTYMLKLYQISKGTFYNSYIRYNEENEDSLKIENIADQSNIYIGHINKNCSCKFLDDNRKIYCLQKRSLIEKINELEKRSELIKFKEEDFYDIIVDVNSILSLNDGWNIIFNEKGLEKYNEFKNQSLLKIGIVGNINNGKSYIFSKLSKIKLPTGVSISTKGLSIKYPKLEKGFEHRKFILLDSAGFENPILINEDEENNQLEEKNYDDIHKFRLKARDILITEFFLQSFVISVSDLLLIVVDKLSFSEQKLINKVKGEIKLNKDKDKKQVLLIIHNLKTYRTIKQVEDYIEEILLKSATFTLKRGDEITSNKDKVKNGIFFSESNKIDNCSIFHLIFAADGSEAGDYYNQYTIDFIEKKYNDDLLKKQFDVINEVKEKFALYSKSIMTKPIEVNDFTSNEECLNDRLIKFKEKKELILKKCQTDEVGFQTFKVDGFVPRYNFYKNGKSVEARVELPGNVEPAIKPLQIIGENTIINIVGEKKKDKDEIKNEDIIYNTREYGNFNLEIEFKTEKHKIKRKLADSKLKNGILLLKYDLDDDDEEEKVVVKVDEEF